MYTSRFIFQIRIDCLGKIIFFFARYFHFVKGKQNIFRMFIKHFSIYFSRLVFWWLGRWEYVSDFVLFYTFIPLAWHLTNGSLLIEFGSEKSQTFEILFTTFMKIWIFLLLGIFKTTVQLKMWDTPPFQNNKNSHSQNFLIWCNFNSMFSFSRALIFMIP